jgi:hypothetical protein
VVLSDKLKGIRKNPSYCIHTIVGLLRSDFVKSELDGACEKAMTYTTRDVLMTTENDWLTMGDKERESKRAILHEYEISTYV